MIQNERVKLTQRVHNILCPETLPNGGQLPMVYGAEDLQNPVSVLNRILAYRPDAAVTRGSNAYRDRAS
jgi:hypothetical protein